MTPIWLNNVIYRVSFPHVLWCQFADAMIRFLRSTGRRSAAARLAEQARLAGFVRDDAAPAGVLPSGVLASGTTLRIEQTFHPADDDAEESTIGPPRSPAPSALPAEQAKASNPSRDDRATIATSQELGMTPPDKTQDAEAAKGGFSVKDYATEVGYRTAALQLTKRMRSLLADALTQHLKGKARTAKRQAILDVLDGPAGGPLVAMLLSGLLPQVAGLVGQDGARVNRLAEELRLYAGVSLTSDLLDGLFGLLAPAKEALTQVLSGLPDAVPLMQGGRADVIEMARAGVTTRAM